MNGVFLIFITCKKIQTKQLYKILQFRWKNFAEISPRFEILFSEISAFQRNFRKNFRKIAEIELSLNRKFLTEVQRKFNFSMSAKKLTFDKISINFQFHISLKCSKHGIIPAKFFLLGNALRVGIQLNQKIIKYP